jgi:hypothetical protein
LQGFDRSEPWFINVEFSINQVYHTSRKIGTHPSIIWADVPVSSWLGLGEVDAPDPSLLRSGKVDAHDPLPLGSGEADVSFSSALCWAIGAPSHGGPFCGHLTAQLTEAAYFEGANP